MDRRLLLLHEEQGPGGVNTLLQVVQAQLAAQGWQIDSAPVRAGRPGLLQLLARARRAQVLVASNNFLPGYWAVMLGLLSQRPSVVWVHGPLAQVLQQRPVSWFKRLLLRWTCQMADALVTVSPSAQTSFNQVFAARDLPLQCVIRNPAPDCDALLPADTAADAGAGVELGFVGRLSPEKRPELLLQMLQHLPADHRLTLVGDGPLRVPLQQQVHALGLDSRVRFAGAQTVTAETYRPWHASLLCSAYEGYPLAALESLAAGIPCITTPLPAMCEMLNPLVPDWVAPQDQARALADAVLRLLQTPASERRRLAQSVARLHPRQHFGAQWHTLLLHCTGQRRPGAQHVHFVHTGPAYLPELDAYAAHLQRLGHHSQRHDDPASVPADADIVWWMCGRVSRVHAHRLRHSLQVHEFASASVGPWAGLKDRIKRWDFPRPDHRVFLNEWVRTRMGFGDDTPSSLRDMGVPAAFLRAGQQSARQADIDHDLVYLGEMGRLLAFVPALRVISSTGLRLLLVGDVPAALQQQIAGLPGITCIGRIAQQDVPVQLLRARAGLNLMPLRLPLVQQTSTKVLEYLAVGLPVISNDYAWAREAADRFPGRILLLADTHQSAVWTRALQQLPARSHEHQALQALAWPQVLTRMPLWAALGLTEPEA